MMPPEVPKWNFDALLFVALGVASIAHEAFQLASASGVAWCCHFAFVIGWSALTALWWKKRKTDG